MSATEDNLELKEPLEKNIIEMITDKISKVKKELKKNINNKKSYFIITGICGVLLILYYANVYSVNSFLFVILWVCAIIFLIAGLGTDTINLSDDLESLEQKKSYYLQSHLMQI